MQYSLIYINSLLNDDCCLKMNVRALFKAKWKNKMKDFFFRHATMTLYFTKAKFNINFSTAPI